MALFVGRLSLNTSSEDVEETFKRYGDILRCEVIAGKGFAFVEYKEKREAEDAIHDLDGSTLNGTRIVVEWARSTTKPANETNADKKLVCFNCGKEGHYIKECKEEIRHKDKYRGRTRSERGRERGESDRRKPAHSRSRSPRH